MTNDTTADDVLFSPIDASRIGLINLENRRKNTALGVPFGVPSVDKVYLPLLPGELETLVARPSNGKTSIMIHRAKQRAKQLASLNMKRAVVYVSAEQTVEEIWAYGVAAASGVNLSTMARGNINDVEWMAIEREAVNYGEMPLWFVGPSREKRKRRPRLTVEVIIEACLRMNDKTGIEPDIAFVDYLQLLKPSKTSRAKTEEMSGILEECKDGALDTGCGWSVAVQAKREVDQQALPIPGRDSGQWTSGVEQFSDKMWAAVRPSVYRQPGEMFGSREVTPGGTQCVLVLHKQKLGKDNVTFWVYLDPAYNKLHDLEQSYSLPEESSNGMMGSKRRKAEWASSI